MALEKNIKNCDDLMFSEGARKHMIMEAIRDGKPIEIDIDKIYEYERHAFKIEENEDMAKLEESIRENGLLVPVILRPKGEDEFECVAGHRRIYVYAKMGKTRVPATIKELSDDDADILMVDSNLTREKLKISEKAWMYRRKYDAMKRRAGRPGKNYSQVGNNFGSKTTMQLMGEDGNDSKTQIARYLKLTELLPEILDAVDKELLPFTVAYEMAFFTQDEQELFVVPIKARQYPSLEDIAYLRNKKKLEKAQITADDVFNTLTRTKGNTEAEKLQKKEMRLQKKIQRTHDGLADAFTWHRNHKNASATDRAELVQKLLNEYFEKMYG